MNADERQKFWERLCNMHDNNPQSIDELTRAINAPRYLCRFRSVNESTLLQLQNNTLYFSSANYYDDPFDTYFYINYQNIKALYEISRKDLKNRNENIIRSVNWAAEMMSIDSSALIYLLDNSSLDFTKVRKDLRSIRDSVQKKLFTICFCENPFNETLWLKYAANHTGFVQIYDLYSSETMLCGKKENCKECNVSQQPPYIYPVYYSDQKYDATKYALICSFLEIIENKSTNIPSTLKERALQFTPWEIERISLIKKKCHEYDQEWRMMRPILSEQRSCIKMKPCKVIVGMRMPLYQRCLVQAAATIAGIPEIHEVYINDSDELDSKPLGA